MIALAPPSGMPEGDPSIAAAPVSRTMSRPQSEPLEFEDVFRTHFGRVTRMLRSLGVHGAHLEDAAQDVFVIVHSKLHEFEGRSSLATWLYAVTFRVAQNHRRKAKLRIHEPLSESEPDRSGDPSEKLAQAQATAFLLRFCASLKEAKRDAFVLCVVEERPAAEVAELLGVSLGTLYSRVSAARADFRRELRRFLVTRESRK